MKKLLSFFFCFLMSFSLLANDKFILVIDPGHGGADGGATRGKIKEKDITLDVALKLGKLIESNCPDVKVVYTRKTDITVDLYKRPVIANKAKANLFISIHVNATDAKTTSATGIETYLLGLAKTKENLAVAKRENSVILLESDYKTRYEGFDPQSPESYIIFEFMTNKYMEQSLDFAEMVQKQMVSMSKKGNRGVRQSGFWVLKQTSMPSVLVELGFINNPTDAAYLTSESGKRVFATSIYNAFIKYKKEFDKKKGGIPSAKTVKENKPIAIDSVEDTSPKEVKISSAGKDSGTFSKALKNKNAKSSASSVPVESRKENKAQKAKTEEPKTKKANSSKVAIDAIEYRVQFLVANSKLPVNSSQLKGLTPVSCYKDGAAYKYTYGATTDIAEAQRIQKEVRKKFTDAFIVKFKNGVRIK
ncbi:N-acetylmuramoyl-L-alanine amidase [Dysgonomonas sp. PH5-45]|uniref:N-acetylmuramoyl-L-alanine amidase family protein n=1 Tax=unclassified Dysgonomonas TaxID=2630389 RepID=UPI002475C37D|nr:MULTISPECIES: N-acetylmuramoyl-L-alanine amidase [unclassified Dysgonomonas]MDH6354321.1 N-acetylmuramoyl-L-alanine amidase [Dysgonomonas sp. PH5-45]MDH6387221.1 N-acetylmuramoyl-L-alanine amidase [Dysgonomonas sp. PH5-37]